MRDHNIFEENLAFSDIGVKKIVHILESKHNYTLLHYNHNKNYDFALKDFKGEVIKYEIKEDVRTKDAGNVVIEYRSRDKPSGIITTQSDFWIFRLHTKNGIVNPVLKVTTIKEMIRNNEFFDKRQMLHTDSKNKLLFFKLDKILKNACMMIEE